MNNKLSRREFVRLAGLTSAAFLTACQRILRPTPTVTLQSSTETPTRLPEPSATGLATPSSSPTSQATHTPTGSALPVVYRTSVINADGLMNIYNALGRVATGKVAVKISSGEPGGPGTPQVCRNRLGPPCPGPPGGGPPRCPPCAWR